MALIYDSDPYHFYLFTFRQKRHKGKRNALEFPAWAEPYQVSCSDKVAWQKKRNFQTFRMREVVELVGLMQMFAVFKHTYAM